MTGGLAKRLCKPLAAVTHLILLAASGARSQVPHRAAAPSAVAAATPRARVHADPAAAPAPAAPPNAWSSRGAAAAPPLRTVDAALCKPFLVEGLFVSGCTEIDSPRGAEPWCAVGNERVLCDRRSIPARSARLPDGSGDPVPCDPSTVVAGRGAVYGCFATEDGSPVMCKSGKRGLLPCISLKAQAPAENTPPPADPAAASQAAVAAGIAAAVAIPLAVGLTFAICRASSRRRRLLATGPAGPPGSKGAAAAMPPSYISSPVEAGDPRPAGAAAAAAAAAASAPRARTSSQYFGGNDARATLIDGDGDRVADAFPGLPGALGKYVIGATYNPSLDDEIQVQIGDIVEVYQEFDDGWCSAINLSRGLTQGVFPVHCIDERAGRIDDTFQPSSRPR